MLSNDYFYMWNVSATCLQYKSQKKKYNSMFFVGIIIHQ